MVKNNNFGFLSLFKRYSDFDKWPLGILLQMIFLRRRYLREFCCYCGDTLHFKRSENIVGDSGEICPTCLRQECRDLYEEMKIRGEFTAEQIAKAEKNRS